MGEGLASRVSRVLGEAVPALAACWMLWFFAQTIGPRLEYLYDLEWMEGGLLVSAWRVREGLSLYPEPGPDYIPFIYPPLYSWVLGALGAVFELGAPLGRWLSAVCSLGAAAALVVAARQERVGWGLALGAAGLFLSCYEDSGAFYDLVRIDGLAMLTLGWALVALRGGWLRAGGLLLVAAFATKHHAAAFGLPALWWVWRGQGRASALRFAAWSVGPALLFLAGMSVATQGRFLVYLLGVPAGHPFVFERFLPGTPVALWEALPFSNALLGLAVVAVGRRASAGQRWWLAHGAMGALLCAIMRGHHGGFINVLIPGHWFLALGGALAGAALIERWSLAPVRVAVGALVAWQCWAGRWEPGRLQPTEADWLAGQAVVERIQKIEGEVLSPYAPWYPVMAGKKPGFALITLWDIDHKWGPYHRYVKDIEAAVAEHRWAAILTAKDDKPGFGVAQHYRKLEALPVKGRALQPKTGWQQRPQFIFVPKQDEPAAPPPAAPPPAP